MFILPCLGLLSGNSCSTEKKEKPNSKPDMHCQIIDSHAACQLTGFPRYMQKDMNTQEVTEVHAISVLSVCLSLILHSFLNIPASLYIFTSLQEHSLHLTALLCGPSA